MLNVLFREIWKFVLCVSCATYMIKMFSFKLWVNLTKAAHIWIKVAEIPFVGGPIGHLQPDISLSIEEAKQKIRCRQYLGILPAD